MSVPGLLPKDCTSRQLGWAWVCSRYLSPEFLDDCLHSCLVLKWKYVNLFTTNAQTKSIQQRVCSSPLLPCSTQYQPQSSEAIIFASFLWVFVETFISHTYMYMHTTPPLPKVWAILPIALPPAFSISQSIIYSVLRASLPVLVLGSLYHDYTSNCC